jgi:hypothetical protein
MDAALAGEELPSQEGSEPTITLNLSPDEIKTIKYAVGFVQRDARNLHFHLHSVVLVAVWSSFETYLQGILSQVLAANTDELSTERQISYREIVANNSSPIDFLIEREVTDFGRLSLTEMIKYVKNRLKFDFQDTELVVLKELYFLRNVAAHNSGFVRASQQAQIPVEISITNNQIQIPLSFLEEKMTVMEAAVDRMDKYIMARWNLPESRDALFVNPPMIPDDLKM